MSAYRVVRKHTVTADSDARLKLKFRFVVQKRHCFGLWWEYLATFSSIDNAIAFAQASAHEHRSDAIVWRSR